MSRPFAQVGAVAFLITGFGGFFTGDAGHVVHGLAGGNFDGVALHLTYVRDVIDLLVAAALGYAGWFAAEPAVWISVLAVSAFLLLLAIVGFVVGDDPAGTRSVAGLHFPLAINLLDLIAGTAGLLSALGDLGAAETSAASG